MIVLATFNARYIHSSLGLRYLRANMAEMGDQTVLLEFIVTDRLFDVAEAILAHRPSIVGLGVYVWNVEQTNKLIRILKPLCPELVIVLGGPEVSHETGEQAIVAGADYVIAGPGDLAFPALCRQLLRGETPPDKVIRAAPSDLSMIELPYRLYSERDIAHRLVYVEASRGCPFRCEFCLSALDERASPFDLDRFLDELDALYQRGARHFKFVDRTFNLKVESGLRILEFFLQRLDGRLFLHFELIPDRLPDPLKQLIRRFPPGSLQFEIGIQTFDPAVQSRISRRQDNRKSVDNLAWLRSNTAAHLHVDLIVGLPGEDLESFGAGFDRLIALAPHEIQVGILKRLRGAPIARHTADFDMVYSPDPPYAIMRNADLCFRDVQRMNRFARYWDLIGNSGRFPRSLALLLDGGPFQRFLRFSDWLYATVAQTHQIALDRLYDAVFLALTELFGEPSDRAFECVRLDYLHSGLKTLPMFLRPARPQPTRASPKSTSMRQARHVRQAPAAARSAESLSGNLASNDRTPGSGEHAPAPRIKSPSGRPR